MYVTRRLGTFLVFLAVSLLTASQCRGQSDHPHLLIKQTDTLRGKFMDKTVVGIAALVRGGGYTFKCERTDGTSGNNLRWVYVTESRSLQQEFTNNGSILTLDNVQDETTGLYRCEDGNSMDDMEELLLSFDNPAVIPVQSNVFLLEGTSLHLAVYSSGDELKPGDHSWRLNGSPIPNVTVSPSGREITVPSVEFQNNSRFSCDVKKEIGFNIILTKTYFNVTVYVPPVFLDSPQSATVDELSNITLTCRASGNPAPTITWSRNDGTAYVRTDTLDSGLPVVTSFYTIDRVRHSAEGDYRCIASIPTPQLAQSELTNESQEASLVVNAILILQHRVGNEELQQTGNVIFITDNMPQVVVNCLGTEDRKWVGPSGMAVANSSADDVYQMYNRSGDAQSLIISPFGLEYSGNYTCKSSVPNLEKSILITMNNPAIFPVALVVFAPQGTMATLSVTVSGSPIPTEENIIWYYEGVPLNANGQYSFGASNRELTINSVESGDYGEYVCEVNTTVGIDRASIMLLEPIRPTADVLPPSVEVVVGQDIKASCTASGSGQLRIEWIKDDIGGLPEGAEATLGGMLMIKTSSLAHAGNYTCMVTNIAGSRTAHLEVTVLAPPEVRIVPAIGSEIQDGNTVHINENSVGTEFLCSATGSPPPVLSWHYDRSIPNVHVRQIAETNSLRLLLEGEVSTNQSGEYACRAENTVAIMTKSFTISVQPPLPPADEKVHVQLRILTRNCMDWTGDQRQQGRFSFFSEVYNSTLGACGCSFDDNQFTSLSFVCSNEVPGAAVFRTTIISSMEVPASTIYVALDSWARNSPTVVILGVAAQVDGSCNTLAESTISPECPSSKGGSVLPFDLWVLIVICVAGGVILVAIFIVVVGCCGYCCRRGKKGAYNTYAKSMTRSSSFQEPYPRVTRPSVPLADMERVYDEPAVSRARSDDQANGHIIMLGSSSDNSSNVEGGYSVLHPDEELDQAFGPTKQTVSPPLLSHPSLMSGVTSSSFVEVPMKSLGSGSDNGKVNAIAEESDRKLSTQSGMINMSSQSVSSGRGAHRQPVVWYTEDGMNSRMPDYSLSQPVYHTPMEPIAYLEPSPLRRLTDAGVKGQVNYSQVRRTSSQLQRGQMDPQIPSGLVSALV